MKRILKRSLAAMLTVIMLVTFVPWSGLSWLADIFATIAKAAEQSSTIEIGEYITLGKYYDEPIVWRCVDIDENGPLMLSDKILCLKAFDAAGNDSVYHTDDWGYIRKNYGSNCWYDSSIRQWLNTSGAVTYTHCSPTKERVKGGYNAYDSENGFLTGFSNGELSVIKTVTQKVYINSYDVKRAGYCDGGTKELNYYISSPGTDYSSYYYQNVTDKIFFLNPSQVDSVSSKFKDYLLNAYLTQQAIDNSDYKNENMTMNTPWSYWLGMAANTGASFENQYRTGCANIGGPKEYLYSGSYTGTIGVRPAFYLNIEGPGEDFNVVNKLSDSFIKDFSIQVQDNDGKAVEGAKVSLFLGYKEIASKNSANNGKVTFLESDIDKRAVGLLNASMNPLSNITVYAEKDVGNEMFLVSSYNQLGGKITDKVVLSLPQFRPNLSVAYTINETFSREKMESIFKQYRKDFYKLTHGKILVNIKDYTGCEDNYGLLNSNKNILVFANIGDGFYDNEETSAIAKNQANPNGYKNDGHIFMTMTFNGNGILSSPVLCHESLHYLIGVYDEYATGYDCLTDQYRLDIDGDGNESEGTQVLFYYKDSSLKKLDPDFREELNTRYKANLKYSSLKIESIDRSQFQNNEFFHTTLADWKNRIIWTFATPICKYQESNGVYWDFGENHYFQKPTAEFGVMDNSSLLKMSTAETYSYLEQEEWGGTRKVNDNHPEWYSAQYFDSANGNRELSVSEKLDAVISQKMNDASDEYGFDRKLPISASIYCLDSAASSFVEVPLEKSGENYDIIHSAHKTEERICDISFALTDKNNIEIGFKEIPDSNISLFVETKADEDYLSVPIMVFDNTAKASFNQTTDNIYRVYVYNAVLNKYNCYSVESFSEELSDSTSVSSLMNVSIPAKFKDDINIISENISYSFEDYFSVGTPFSVVSFSDTNKDELDFVQNISYNSDIDFTSLTAFLVNGNEYTKLDTSYYSGEDNCLYVSFPYSEDGRYVLMAKRPQESSTLTPENLTVSVINSGYEKNIEVSFDDPNDFGLISSYNLYFSKEEITDINAEGVYCTSISSEKIPATLYLDVDYAEYYFAVEAVGYDGGRSPLSSFVQVNIVPNDSDNDGIPDFWVSMYPALADFEDIAGTDSDEDGLNNLQEYENGTNPLDPDTDGDNVHDYYETVLKLNPLEPMTDGVTDDYTVVYGSPDVYIDENLFVLNESTVTCTISNNTYGKAMRTYISLYDANDNLLEMAVVNLDKYSSVEYTFPREYLVEGFRIVLDEDKITRDTNYDNNEFVYVPAEGIVAKSNEMIVTKGENVNFDYELIPENASKIVSVSSSDSTKILVDKYGTITGKIIGKCTVTAVTATGHSCSMEVVVEPIPGAGLTDFDCRIINDNQVEIIGYVGSDINVEVPSTIAEMPVVSIGDGAFVGCTFESSILPETLKTIDEDAFYNCVNLKSITIPDSVVEIGDYAFDSCSNLSSITIGSNIREIGNKCFYDCINLNTVYYNAISCSTGYNQRYAPFVGCSALEKCIISDDVIDIPRYLFYGVSSLKEVEMGKNVEYIGKYAFSGCTSLEYIALSENLYSISNHAFEDCSSLSTLILPEKLSSIGPSAFRNCSSIYSAIIPDSVSSIGSHAFSGCTNLTDISIANDKASVYGNSFDSTAYYNSESNWKDGLLYIDNHLITGKNDLINGVIKSGTVRIANSAFADNTSLTRITIPKTVEVIGTSAFSNCTGLTSVVIPTSVEQIESSAFSGCTALGQVSVYNKDCIISNSSTVFPETAILYGYSNSTTQEYATNFSRTFVSLHEHDYSYVVKVEPTVMNEGYIERSCSCGDTITETIPSISQKCIVKNNMLIGLEQGLCAEELLEKYLVSNTSTITLSRDVVGTGTTVEIINGDGICEEYEIVIIGDVNGDSWYDGQDAIVVDCLANGMLTKEDVGEAVYMAADCNHDGVIDQLDVALLNEAGTLLSNVDQSKPAEVLLETSAEYVEYISLIDQSPEIEDETDTPEADAEETPETDVETTPEQDAKVDIFEMILNFIKSIIEMLLAFIPVQIK